MSLTSAEINLIDDIGNIGVRIHRLLAADADMLPDAPGQQLPNPQAGDWDEIASDLHRLQHFVMARSALRSHPEIFARKIT